MSLNRSSCKMAKSDLGEEVREENIFLEGNIPKDFEGLDQTFRCPICASLFDKAVMIKECGHSFCSVCIRNYWVATRSGIHRQEKACPICRTAINVMDVEKALVMNRSIQEGVKAFKQMLINHYRSSTCPDEESPPTRSSRRGNSRRKSSATTSYDRSRRGDETSASSNDGASGDEEEPVKRKMESRNYARMKKKDLQRLCREFKIPSSGSEQELIDRVRNYQNMWNAEVLHSISPKRPSDIAAKLKKEEQAQRDEEKLAEINGASNSKECMRKLNATISSGNQKVTSGNAIFDRELKSNFEAMTAQLRLRMKKKIADGSVVAAYDGSESKLSCGIEKRISMTVPTASSIEIIDIKSCSSGHDRSSAIDTNQKPVSSHSTGSPDTKLISSEKSSSSRRQSSCKTKPRTTTPVGRQSGPNKHTEKERKRKSRTSSLPTTRVGWACSRCTYENKGIDYVCQICGFRKT